MRKVISRSGRWTWNLFVLLLATMSLVATVIGAEKARAVANMITGIVEAADGSEPPDGSQVFLFTDYTLSADPTSTVYIRAVFK